MTNSDCANEWHRHHWSTDWLIGSRGCLPCSIAVGALRVAALVDTFKRTSQRRALYALVVAYACACSASLQAGSVAEDASKTDAALQVDVTDTVISSASFLPRSLNPVVVYAPQGLVTSSIRVAPAAPASSPPLVTGTASQSTIPAVQFGTPPNTPAQLSNSTAQQPEQRRDKPSPDVDSPSARQYAPFAELNHSSP